jgi:hypothetical protein
MKLSKRKARLLARARRAEAEGELSALRDALRDAYRSFQRSTEPALVEASILELSALEARYGRALRNLKALIGEKDYGISDSHHPRGHRRSDGLAAAEAAEKAHQMGH